MKIKDIPVSERPRERLIEYGSNSLSNEELLAIILKQGTKNKSAKELGLDLINSIGNISNLDNITLEKLINIKGIGQAQALTLLASIELGRRIYLKKDYDKKYVLSSSKKIYEFMKYLLINKKQEYFYCLYVNNRKELIERKLLFMGTVNSSPVHPREVFKNAYLNSASGIICVHNHPSGDVMPSNDDLFLTETLVKIGKINGIPVLDHIIVGKDNYYSMFDSGIINL